MHYVIVPDLEGRFRLLHSLEGDCFSLCRLIKYFAGIS